MSIERCGAGQLQHAVADGEGIVRNDRPRCVRREHPIHQMPGTEFGRAAWIFRQPKPEQALRMPRQVQHHHTIAGAKLQRHRALRDGAPVIAFRQLILEMRNDLVLFGPQFDLARKP